MTSKKPSADAQQNVKNDHKNRAEPAESDEVNGYKDLGLPKPTRYGDWEVKGRCSDF